MFARARVFVVIGLFAAAAGGCKPKDSAIENKPADTASSKPTATAADTTPAAAPAASGDVALPTGDPYKLKDLAAIVMPKPAGAPATGNWKDIGDNESDGYGQMNYVDDKENYWFGLDFLDCRAKVVRDVAGSKEDRGALKWCFMQPNAKFKTYPMIKPEKGSARAVKAGNVWVVVSLGMTGKERLKAADVEAYLDKLDLAAVAKL